MCLYIDGNKNILAAAVRSHARDYDEDDADHLLVSESPRVALKPRRGEPRDLPPGER